MDFLGLIISGTILLILLALCIAGLVLLSSVGLQTIVGWAMVFGGVSFGTYVLLKW